MGANKGRYREGERSAREKARLQEQVVGRAVEGQALKREVIRRESLERSLRAANANLERVNKELDTFAYAISHDLIAPLRKCKVLLGFLEEDQDPPLNAAAKSHMQAAIGMADQMAGMIQGVLAYTRAREPIALEPIELKDVLEEALNNLGVAITESGAVVNVSELPLVAGHHVRLVQLFQNLLQNAIRYRSTRPLEVDISAAQVKGGCCVSVRDNGKGIEGRSVDDAFILFRKGHTGGEGFGIGLALCKQIAESHGGDITVETEVGVGSTFHVTLTSPSNKKR